MSRISLGFTSRVVAAGLGLAWLTASPATAQMPEPTPSVPASPPSPEEPTPAVARVPTPGEAPADAPGPDSAVGKVAASASGVDAPIQSPGSSARYGIGVRTRWATVPRWLLGLFLDESVPLSSYTVGLEGFRRTGNFDVVLGVAWQSLSPSDGNWLGKGNPPATQTNFVQFEDLGAVSVDVALLRHVAFTRRVGMHYGGGVGLGIVTGKVLRTSAGSAGCAGQPGSTTDCHPVVCATGPCTEAELKATEGGTDGPSSPSRFREDHVPPVYPLVNLVTGLDFSFDARRDLSFKLDLGYFFPYLFVGAGVGYRL